MKKSHLILGTLAFLLLTVGVTLVSLSNVSKASGGPFALGIKTLNGLDSASATTTYTSLTPSGTEAASSTLTMYTEGVETIQFNFLVQASSTNSILNWHYAFSNNNIDWYDESCTPTVTSNVLLTEGATYCRHQWAIPVTAPSTKSVKLDSIAAKYTRLYIGSQVGSTTITVNASLKTPF